MCRGEEKRGSGEYHYYAVQEKLGEGGEGSQKERKKNPLELNQAKTWKEKKILNLRLIRVQKQSAGFRRGSVGGNPRCSGMRASSETNIQFHNLLAEGERRKEEV